MSAAQWFDRGVPVAGAPAVRGIDVDRDTWSSIAADFARPPGRLIALWAAAGEDDTAGEGAATAMADAAAPSGDGVVVLRAAYACAEGVLVAALALRPGGPPYPGLQDHFPAANRMQRAIHDVYGLRSTDADLRPWLLHSEQGNDYPFVRVEGEGVHEIPVGPVHAGIIEPGHFRFSVVGEKVLRLEQRLGYTHKGVEARFREFPADAGHRLAARVSGDSAVAFSWAYAQALEGLAAVVPPARAAHLRALGLELERIANHLGDLGALGNDAGFAFGLSQFSRLKEAVLRATEAAFGQRYLFDLVVPGGTRVDIGAPAAAGLRDCLAAVAGETATLRGIYDEHSGLRGRFGGAGVVTPALAARLGLTGLAGRASGQAFDWRIDRPTAPYDVLEARKCGQEAGDVAARVALRFDELFESCRLCRTLLESLPPGAHQRPVGPARVGELGLGLIEGWRGPVLVGLVVGPGGRILSCHPHDPSWQNWPVLEHAIIDNIVPDFPLINKSFNLSYSGQDL
jgi:Ni,Fe-hydrogenase III large subunit